MTRDGQPVLLGVTERLGFVDAPGPPACVGRVNADAVAFWVAVARAAGAEATPGRGRALTGDEGM